MNKQDFVDKVTKGQSWPSYSTNMVRIFETSTYTSSKVRRQLVSSVRGNEFM